MDKDVSRGTGFFFDTEVAGNITHFPSKISMGQHLSQMDIYRQALHYSTSVNR